MSNKLIKQLPAIIVMAGLSILSPSLRAEEPSKADQLRAEAKRLMQLANELDRKETGDADRKPEKPKLDKQPAIKKELKEPGDKVPVEAQPKKIVKDAPSDKFPVKPEPKKLLKDPVHDKVPVKPEPKKEFKEPGHEKVPHVKDVKPIDAPAPRVKFGPDGKVLVPKDQLMLKPAFPKGDPGAHVAPPVKQRIPNARPAGEAEQKLAHMMEAAKHLREAGINDMADNLERGAAEMKRRMAEQRALGSGPDTAEARQLIEQLRREVIELRESIKRMQQEDGRR